MGRFITGTPSKLAAAGTTLAALTLAFNNYNSKRATLAAAQSHTHKAWAGTHDEWTAAQANLVERTSQLEAAKIRLKSAHSAYKKAFSALNQGSIL